MKTKFPPYKVKKGRNFEKKIILHNNTKIKFNFVFLPLNIFGFLSTLPTFLASLCLLTFIISFHDNTAKICFCFFFFLPYFIAFPDVNKDGKEIDVTSKLILLPQISRTLRIVGDIVTKQNTWFWGLSYLRLHIYLFHWFVILDVWTLLGIELAFLLTHITVVGLCFLVN